MVISNQVKESISNLPVEVYMDVEIKKYTNTKTGGIVPAMIYPKVDNELIEVVKILKLNSVNYVVLGEMANVAIASGSLDFVVINMSKFNNSIPKLSGRNLSVSANFRMKDLTQWGIKNKIRDLEWMEGIPGTIGAGVFMNAGFLSGQDMQHVVLKVRYLDINTLEIKWVDNEDIHFGYRYSDFQKTGHIVLEVVLLVNPMQGKKHSYLRMLKSKHLVRKYHKRRAKNQPLSLPSAGTTFIPPMPYHVGGMLREMNLVGFKKGGAQISTKSPGFIVGINNMSGEDYFDMVTYIQTAVSKKYDVNLRTEVRLFGFGNEN